MVYFNLLSADRMETVTLFAAFIKIVILSVDFMKSCSTMFWLHVKLLYFLHEKLLHVYYQLIHEMLLYNLLTLVT